MTRRAWPLGLACAVAACGPSEDGEVRITAYGESFIEDGIPAAEMDDAWAVRFDRFVLTFDDVVVGGVTIRPAEPVDLSVSTGGDGHLLASARVPAGTHTAGRYTVARVDLSGSATKNGLTKTFTWSFERPAEYVDCETTTVVDGGKIATFEITIHADHLFYDSLVSEQPQVLFQALADADANLDGEITPEELRRTGIGAYDPGNTNVIHLWDWLAAQYRTIGHVDGEGHCNVRSSA